MQKERQNNHFKRETQTPKKMGFIEEKSTKMKINKVKIKEKALCR